MVGGVFCCLNVIAVHFGTGSVLAIIVTAERLAVRHLDEPAVVGLAHLEELRGITGPIGVLKEQIVQTGDKVAVVTLAVGDETDHVQKEWRLRTAQVVGAVTGRDEPELGKHVLGIVHHAVGQVMPPACFQAEHGEVRVPVVLLAETAARDDVGFWKGEQGAGRVRRFAGQAVPGFFDVGFGVSVRGIERLDLSGTEGSKMLVDKGREVEILLFRLLLVEFDDATDGLMWDLVDERLAVGVDPAHLHHTKKLPESFVGRLLNWLERPLSSRGRGAQQLQGYFERVFVHTPIKRTRAQCVKGYVSHSEDNLGLCGAEFSLSVA